MSRYIAKKNAKFPLPSLPSALLKVALKDLKKAEASPLHAVQMDVWHGGISGLARPQCEVCFAGSVMAFSLKTSSRKSRTCWSFGNENVKRFEFLNMVRDGFVPVSYLVKGAKDFAAKVIPYEESPEKFKKGILRLIDRLKRKGL